MKGTTWLVLAATATALYYSVQKFLNKYTTKLGKVKFNWLETEKRKGKAVAFDVTIILNNPTFLSAAVRDINLTVLYNNVVIAKTQSHSGVTVKPNGNTDVPVTVVIPLVNTVQAIQNAIQRLLLFEPLQVTIKGTLSVSGFKVPFEDTTTLVQ